MKRLTLTACFLLLLPVISFSWELIGSGVATSSGTPTQIVETATSGVETGILSSYTIGQSFASQEYPLSSIAVNVYSGTGTLTCRVVLS